MKTELKLITTNPTGATTPTGVALEIGSRWKEVDPRFDNPSKEVVGFDPVTQRVHFKGPPKTSARLDRFSGKRGGYVVYEKPQTDPAKLMVTEGVGGTFYYHLSRLPVVAQSLCGSSVMATKIPLSAWGTVGHLQERYCRDCVRIANLPTLLPMHERPLAQKGLKSYRYKHGRDHIMIGATDHHDALREAERSLLREFHPATLGKLQLWSQEDFEYKKAGLVWEEVAETEVCAALSHCGDYVISHRPKQFICSYRPPGQHNNLGTFLTLQKAIEAAENHADEKKDPHAPANPAGSEA